MTAKEFVRGLAVGIGVAVSVLTASAGRVCPDSVISPSDSIAAIELRIQSSLLAGDTASVRSLDPEWQAMLDSRYGDDDIRGIQPRMLMALAYMSYGMYDRSLGMMKRIEPACRRLGLMDTPEILPPDAIDTDVTLRNAMGVAYGYNALSAPDLHSQLQLCSEGLEIMEGSRDSAAAGIRQTLVNVGVQYGLVWLWRNQSAEACLIEPLQSFIIKYAGERSPEYRLSELTKKYFEAIGASKVKGYLAEEIVPLCERLYGSDSLLLIWTLIDTGMEQTRLGSVADGLKSMKRAERICRTEYGVEGNSIYMLICANLSEIYGKCRDRRKAMEWIDKTISNAATEGMSLIASDMLMLGNRKGETLRALNDPEEAVRVYGQVLAKCDSLIAAADGPERKNLENCRAFTLLSMAMSSRDAGEIAAALRYSKEAMDAYKIIVGGNSTIGHKTVKPVYRSLWQAMETYAASLADLGNYREALVAIDECLGMISANAGDDNHNYVNALNQKALICYFAQSGDKDYQYPDPVKIGNQVLEQTEKILGTAFPDYINYLANQSLYCLGAGEYEKAYDLTSRALADIESREGKENDNTLLQLNNLMVAQAYLGRFDAAVKTGEEALRIREKVSGRNHREYIRLLGNLMSIYDHSENRRHNPRNIVRIKEYVPRYASLYREDIRTKFTALTSKERSSYVHMFGTYVSRVHDYVAKYGDREMNGAGYDMALANKGLLLGSDIGFRKLIGERGDSVTKVQYEALQALRVRISDLQGLPIAERMVNVDSLELLANDYERELVMRSADFGDYTHNLSIGWRQVRDALTDDDVAVEFVKFNRRAAVDGDSEERYMAYVVCKELMSPAVVDLFTADSLDSVKASEYYTSDRLGHLLWDRLKPYITDKKCIYFSPDGALYNIAVESVPVGVITGKELYRLSSTRELALRHDNDKPAEREAVLYGGLDYDNALADAELDGKNTGGEWNRGAAIMDGESWRDVRHILKKLPYLPGTLTEVDKIGESLKRAGYDTKVYTAAEGTETSLKRLSGQRTGTLHIATHGFYYGKEDKDSGAAGIEGMTAGGKAPEEEQELRRSGLLMAGAGRTVRGDSVITGAADDGILTAAEIAALDLRGLDLVVMSACQTGLGIVKGDGVFGLQRGFKKSGARSLLMSLWKVDDNATELLMDTFYQGLTSGLSKHASLQKAQHTVRTYSINRKGRKLTPYSHPRYWAAFILLDAL